MGLLDRVFYVPRICLGVSRPLRGEANALFDAWMFSCRVRADIAPRRITEVRKELSWWIDWIPRFLAAVPFISVLVGLWKAWGVVAQTKGLAPARDAATQIYILAALDLGIGFIFLAFLWSRQS